MNLPRPAPGQILTVRQLKHLLAQWPETDRDGADTQVFAAVHFGLVCPCATVAALHSDVRRDGQECANLLLGIRREW